MKMRLYFPALALAAALTALCSAAATPSVTRDSDGVIHVGDLDFRIIHWSNTWAPTVQNSRSVSLPGEGGDHVEGKGLRRTGAFSVANGQFHYTETVHSPSPEQLNMEYELEADTPVPTATLALCATFPADMLIARPPIYNGRPFCIPPVFDEKRFQTWSETRPVNTLELSLPAGRLVISGNFSAMWQDDRKYGENKAQLRLGFRPKMSGALRQAAASFAFTLQPYETTPVDMDSAMNMGFKDECADDRKGGWTDQGPDNDLSMMEPGERNMGGVTFRIVDPASNGGKSCIVLRGPQREYFPAEATVAASGQGKMLFLLNAIAWPPSGKQPVGEVEIAYVDGSVQTAVLHNTIDTANFWFPAPLPNGVVVWEGVNSTSNIGLYATGIPIEDKPLRSLRFRSRNAVWMIVAASLSKTEMKPEVAGPVEIRSNALWKRISHDNDIVPGSVADFSHLLDAPAGKYGFCRVAGENFEFSGQPGVPVRFWGSNLTFLANYLTHAESDRTADRMAAAGMNLVRLHHFDQEYVAGTYCKIDSFRERRDRIDYLVAACKKRGIYLTLDLFTYRFVEGKQFGYPDRRLTPVEYKALVLFDPAVRRDFIAFAKALLEPVNPYTGLAWKDDPAFAFIDMINETMLPDSILRSPLLQEVVNRQFSEYAAEHNLHIDDGNRDVQRERFVMEKTRQCVGELAGELRTLGIKVPLSDINVGCDPRIGLMRRELEFVDNHMYWGHPTYLKKLWVPPVAITAASATSAFAGGLNIMFPTRIFGKPFTITEWNFLDPNPYNVEGPFLTGAYGALQGYSAFCRFEWGITGDSSAMNGFWFCNDPLQLMAMRAGSCFFLRGDVRPAVTAIPMAVPENLPGTPEWQRFPEAMQRVGLMVRTGMIVENDAIPPGTAGFISPGNQPGISGFPVLFRPYTSELLNSLSDEGVLPPALMDLENGRFTSETGEIELCSPQKSLKIITANSEAVLGEPGTALEGIFAQITIKESFGAVFVTAHDNRPLTESRRIFVCHLTDLKGEGMRFLDRGMSVIDNWGSDTMLMRRGSARLVINSSQKLKVYACATSGKRLFPVATTPAPNGGFSFTAENFTGGQAVCVYELTAE